MNLDQIIEIQKEFDSQHRGKFNWDERINENNIEMLEYLLLCLVGEFGEATNLIKKVVRGDCLLQDIKSELSEELADIFIYVIKLAYQLNVDLEEEFIKKISKNRDRFHMFEKSENHAESE